jgi:tetratricopeptide (TPR) repeat protein
MNLPSASAPIFIEVPGFDSGRESRLLLLRDDRVIAALELTAVHRASATPQGGFVAPARSGNGKWGYIDENARWLVEPTLDDARTFTEDGIARFQRDGLWGYLNLAGEIIIAPTYKDCRAFRCGLAPVLVGKNKWTYINTRGETVFERSFSTAMTFEEHGLAVASASPREKFGYISTSGEWAVAPQFSKAKSFGKAGVAPVSLDGHSYGLIDRNGNWVLKPRYPSIEEFNADGLAYFDEEDSWTKGHGYLNANGDVVVKGDRHLSDVMRCGIASADYNGSRYLTKNNKSLIDQYLSFGSHFNAHGFAVVRTSPRRQSASNPAQQDKPSWHILRDDGSLESLPNEVLEPLTDSDGWLVYARSETPFAPFLTRDKNMVYLDRDARIVFRIRYEQRDGATAAQLYDTAGQSLWHSAAGHIFQAPTAFFEQTIDAHLDQLRNVNQVVAFARTMLSDTENKLHRFASGESLVDTEIDDADESEEDEPRDDADCVVTKKRLVRAYVDESHNGYYDFLSGVLSDVVDEAGEQIKRLLVDEFGEADHDPEFERHVHDGHTFAWRMKLVRPVSGASSALEESRDLWLAFFPLSDSGDGDAWHELWMICAPSIDAMHVARRARTGTGTSTTEHPSVALNVSTVRGDVEAPPLPTTYDEWLIAVRDNDWNIAGVPRAMLDEPMIDAAIEADVRALRHLPGELQTEARLAALIRKDVATAREIPVKCMTQAGLALARSLYEDENEWKWYDERRSRRPKKWDKNSLYDIWGALLNENDCVLAMKGGESLNNVPHWLRSERVENTALSVDMYNISYIDKEKITPALAVRAVQHDYGQLIARIPASLVTAELCLTSARVNGLSLEHIPKSFRTHEVCIAAMKDDPRCFPFVPLASAIDVCTALIEKKRANDNLEPTAATRWHSYRAWAHLWRGEYEQAIADATLALNYADYYAAHAHYIRASAYRALGRRAESAMDAASVLTVVGDDDHYQAEFDEKEDTSWLREFADSAKKAIDNADDATLLDELKQHPLALENVPRERITREMIDVAVANDPDAVQFVPRRLMTPELYALAVKERYKRFSSIPASMLSEASCIEEVRNSGYSLPRIPMQWRTVRVCAQAVHDRESAIEDVPEAIRDEVLRFVKQMPRDDEAEEGDDDQAASASSAKRDWLAKKLVEQIGGEDTKLKRAKFTGLAMLLGMGAKDDTPPTLRWPLSWLEQRAFAAMMINASFALTALICHLVVTIHAWRMEGVWVGLATAVFMGLSEIYWVWRFFTNDPLNWALAINALVVIAYCFVYRWIHKKVVTAIAAKSNE